MRLGNVEDFEVWVELNDVRIAGTCGDFVLTVESIGGLGLPDVKSADLNRLDDHGSVAADDYAQSRQIFFPIALQRDTAREAMTALQELKTAWKASRVEDELSIFIPGIGPVDDTLRFYGRPRSTLDVILRGLPGGVISAFANFAALDPVGYGPVTTISGSGTFTVTNEGNADSRRAVVEIIGDGGIPSLVNASDGGADVRFSQALGVGQSWFVDLRNRTVIDGSGDDVFPNNVLQASIWPKLVPGDNSLTLDGADSANVVYRSGWW